MRYIDAHNHLQDERLAPFLTDVMAVINEIGVAYLLVNGSSPSDWKRVALLSESYKSIVVPNFGVHPWYINGLDPNWEQILCSYLDRYPSGIGETGIDGFRKDFNSERQESVFVRQLEISAQRNLPISIHGLRRWGRLLQVLNANPRPKCGFLLHSYGGPVELIPDFVKLGGYFSCPGAFFKPGREAKLETFKRVPRERLFLETDAPDQNLPEQLDLYHLRSPIDLAPVNHPANIALVYSELAKLLNCSVALLCRDLEANFNRLFESVIAQRE